MRLRNARALRRFACSLTQMVCRKTPFGKTLLYCGLKPANRSKNNDGSHPDGYAELKRQPAQGQC
jgi:hypothetical protein